MLKTIYKQITRVIGGKLEKSVLKEKFQKHPNYLVKAKELWAMINEDLRISDTVENKIITKVDKFEKALVAKFPELTKDDVNEIKESIIGEFNSGKDVALKQLQDFNTKLQEENAKLKNHLSKFRAVDTENTVTESKDVATTAVTESNDATTTITEEVKEENIKE